jgi:hypothetical protein
MFVAPFEIGEIALHLFRAARNMGLKVSGKTIIRSRGWLLATRKRERGPDERWKLPSQGSQSQSIPAGLF